ncbi:MAG: TIGR00296 family protein [Candidatus Aenigmarchaeota archaeon]|nr:TIGR00296 family protein [Candidatus Aenigmarchaeota archaeon]
MEPEDGVFAVKLARKAIEFWVEHERTLEKPVRFPEDFKTLRGVFTTIHTYPENSLRGCIGYPYPVLPLISGIIRSAAEATQDPRFPPLGREELDKVIIELSILTEPEEIEVKKPEEYLKKIIIGRDGLIIKKGLQSGLLLPQVPAEQGWDVKTFLENLCWKAGMEADEWKSERTEILRFRAEIFAELEPNGEIAAKE